MVKKAVLLLTAIACSLSSVNAQKHCYTDEVENKLRAQYPEIATYEAQLKADIDKQLSRMNLAQFKTTGSNDTAALTLHVPIVFHVVHDYGVGQDYVTDNQIYEALKGINRMYNKQNPDTSQVIATYAGFIPGTNVRYIGNANIVFHLPSKDPEGKPTHGIIRKRSYLTHNAGDQAKYDIWPPQSYLNIWIIRKFGNSHDGAAAYAYQPPTANVLPYVDGVITLWDYLNTDNTLSHEIGHSLSLAHPWGNTNDPDVACGDDNVDDTPPTKGHNPPNGTNGCNNLLAIYDTACSYTKAVIGKFSLNTLQDVADAQNGVGISFNTFSKINLDTLTFYPVDSGKAYQIVLKHNNNVVNTFNGVTTNNKITSSFAKTALTQFNATADATVGKGVKFRIYDSVFIKTVTIYPKDSGEAYQVVLKMNGVVVADATGVTNTDTLAQVIPLNFSLPFVDTLNEYSIEFGVNPLTKRDLYTTGNTVKLIPGAIRILSDTSNGRYNYFYNWNIQTFNYPERPVVHFVIPRDTTPGAYSLEFSDNPGAKRDLGSATLNTVSNGLTFTDDNDQGRYNYFYNWRIRTDYFKFYSSATAAALFNDASKIYIDYPDTVNSQNVMDYTYCSKMFTYLQTLRMRGALNSSVAGRSNLIDTTNLINTGVMNPNGSLTAWQDIAPVADFSTNRSFVCTNQAVQFVNQSWQDTIATAQWAFGGGATVPTSASLTTVTNQFTTPGWTSVSLIVKGNGANGSYDTLVRDNAIYVASPNTTDPVGYFQEFNSGGDLDQYPIFNYYENAAKWEVTNTAGFYDNTSIRYRNYDDRIWPGVLVGTPAGDYDDFFTPAFDLTKISGPNANLTFLSAGAFRTNLSPYMNDTLEISYSNLCGGLTNTWTLLKRMTKLDIGNNGVHLEDYTPSDISHWKFNSISLNAVKAGASASKVYFRFRFKPGADADMLGSGNNFYLDRIHISSYATAVDDLETKPAGVAIAPNPTTGSTFVLVKDAKNATAKIVVTDITGKVVYNTEARLNGNVTSIEIPSSYINVKGVYLVQVLTGNSRHTEKLVVY